MLEDLATGVQHSVIARKNNISLRTVRREIGRALDKCWSETPQRHLRLQVERLNLALRAIDDALLVGDLSAVEPLLKVTERLDRYNALAHREPAVEPPPLPRLALSHSGQNFALSALESPALDMSTTPRED